MVPEKEKTINMVSTYTIRYLIPKGEIKPAIIPIWAEHGIVKPNKKVAITFSLFDPSKRVEMVAMVTHTNPRIIGMTALPLRPNLFRVRSA